MEKRDTTIEEIVSNLENGITQFEIGYKSVAGYLLIKDIEVLYAETKKCLKDKFSIMEIGSHKGLSAIILSIASNYAPVTCIDMWTDDGICQKFLENTKEYTNITHIKIDSKNYKSKEKYDLVFIDGDHTLDWCLSDLRMALRSLKKGGIILGHDCVEGCSVVDAVNKFVVKNKLKLEIFENTQGLFKITR